MKNTPQDTIKSMLATVSSLMEDVDLSKIKSESAAKRGCLSFQLPYEYKRKYESIQEKTSKQFGKALAEIIKRSIDKVDSSVA